MPSTIPVTICTVNTASVALPSVCNQVRPPGILRSINVARIDAMSIRSSIHRRMAPMLHADPLGHAEPEVAVVDEDRAVANLHRQLVERAWRRTCQHGTGLDVELDRKSTRLN